MKKINFILILGIIIAALSGCAKTYKYPLIVMEFSDVIYDKYSIPLRDNYTFADNLYEIVETEEGYNIVVKCVPKDSPRAFTVNP